MSNIEQAQALVESAIASITLFQVTRDESVLQQALETVSNANLLLQADGDEPDIEFLYEMLEEFIND